MSRRTERLASGLQQQLAKVLEANMPPGTFLTITRAIISPDNRWAQVWIAGWAVMPAHQQRELQHVLQLALAKVSTTKFTPHIQIENDTSAEYAEHIARLIDSDKPSH